MNSISRYPCSDYMAKFYLGSIVWQDRSIPIYTDKQRISFHSVQDNVDGTSYVSSGSIEIGIKTFLKEAEYESILSQHPMAKEIAKKLGVKRLCLLCDDQGIEAYIWKGIRTEKRNKAESRKAFIPIELNLGNKLYAGIEFKGCGCEGGPINLEKFRTIGNTGIDTCVEGGVYLKEIEKESNFMKDSPLLLATFALPIEVTSPYHGTDKLGLLVRATECSFRLSQIKDIKQDLLSQLNISEEQYNETVSKNLVRHVRQMLESGYFHPSPTEENVDALGNLTDLLLKPIKSSADVQFNLMNYKRILSSLNYNSPIFFEQKDRI